MTTALDTTTTALFAHLWRGGNYAYYWTASEAKDDKNEAIEKITTWFEQGQPAAIPADTGQHGPRHIYFSVNPTTTCGNQYQRAKKGERDTAAVNCLFGEYDLKDFGSYDAIFEHLKRSPKPTVVVFSGGGYHCYWLLDEPFLIRSQNDYERAKNAQYAWVDFVTSDGDAKDLQRVLRVPGTRNYKTRYAPDYPLVEVVSADFSLLYSLAHLEKLSRPAAPEKTIKQTANHNGDGLNDLERAAGWLKRLDAGRADEYKSWIDVGMSLSELGTAGLALWEAWSQRSSKYHNGECQKKWKSFTANDGLTLGSLKHWADTDNPVAPASNGNGQRGNGIGQPAPAEAEPKSTEQHNRLTDLGNARRLVSLFGKNIRYVPAWGKWFAWDGTRWQDDETGAVMRLAKRVPLAIYQEALEASEENRPKVMKWGATPESHGKLEEMIKLARTEPGMFVKHKALDSNQFLLNCKNGTIDLATGHLLEHNRDDLITKRLDIEYHADAQCPLWLAFLDRIFAGDQELIAYIQRAVGYTLTGDIGEQCLFFMHGGGDNGKSVFSETIKSLLGEYGQKAPVEMIMAKFNTGGATNDIARLAGARFVVVSEIEEGRRLAENLVKDLTGGDTMAARFLYQDTFEFEPTHKLWMYGNHKPEIRGTDNGIWRRMRLIPFAVTIPKEEQDEQLPQKLRAELPGILAWAVQGCLEWQRTRLKTPRVVTSATDSYRAEMDVLSDFLEECCVKYVTAKVKANMLHQAYLEWCKESNEPRPLSRRAFGNRLRERGYVSDLVELHLLAGLGIKEPTTGRASLE